jgi:hypothetical protein
MVGTKRARRIVLPTSSRTTLQRLGTNGGRTISDDGRLFIRKIKTKIKHKIMAQKTKEEQIVFQNQSHLVQKYFNDCGICPDLLDIALATDIMVQFAISGFSKDLKERFDNFQKYCNEKYKNDPQP